MHWINMIKLLIFRFFLIKSFRWKILSLEVFPVLILSYIQVVMLTNEPNSHTVALSWIHFLFNFYCSQAGNLLKQHNSIVHTKREELDSKLIGTCDIHANSIARKLWNNIFHAPSEKSRKLQRQKKAAFCLSLSYIKCLPIIFSFLWTDVVVIIVVVVGGSVVCNVACGISSWSWCWVHEKKEEKFIKFEFQLWIFIRNLENINFCVFVCVPTK